MTPTERFVKVLDELRKHSAFISYVELGRMCPSLYTMRINRIREGRSNVTLPMLNELQSAFPQVDANYFFCENVPMFR